MEYTIYSFGNGEILKGVFDAIAICLNAHSGTLYTPLIRLSLIIGGLWVALYAIYGDYIKAITHWIIPMTIIMQLLFVPQASVWIIDPVSRYSDKVDHVPYGLALIAGRLSQIGMGLTEQIEKIFRLPDELKYQKTGTLFASHLIQQAKTFQISNEDLAENMRQFVGECVTYDVALGTKYRIQDLRHSANLWELVSNNASPIRSFIWRDLHREGEARARPQIITCQQGIAKFNAAWQLEKKAVSDKAGKKLFGHHLNPGHALLQHLPLAYGVLTNLSQSAEELLQQQMMISAIVDGFESKSTRLGNAPHFAIRRAYLQQRATYENLGAMAAETLPSIKAVLEALAYSAFLFVIPLAVLPFGWRFLASWLQVLVWLQMWAPLYAILNYIMTMAARSKSIAALSVSNVDGITIANSVGLVNVNADIAAMTGYLALSIPFLCIAMVKGLSSFASMASQLTQVTQGAGTQTIQDALTGNYNFGNIGMSGRQISNTQMLNHSYAASIRSGSFHRSDGQMDVTTSSDGQQIVNMNTPNLPIQLNVSEMLSNQKQEQSTQSYQKALQQSEAYFGSLIDVYKSSVELAKHLNKNKQLTTNTSQGTTVDHTKSLNKMGQIANSFEKTDGVNEQRSAQITTGLGLALSALPPVGPLALVSGFGKLLAAAGLALSIKGTMAGSANKVTNHANAEKLVKNEDFQEAFRQTQQALQNKTFGQLDEEGQRLTDVMNQAWEKSQGIRLDANKSFREAEDYQQQSTYLKNSASTVNANYGRVYWEWLINQPANNAIGRLGEDGATYMMNREPHIAMLYAERFLAEQGRAPQKPKDIPDDPKAYFKNNYQNETGHRIVPVDEKNAYQKMQALKVQASEQGLHPVNDEGLLENFKNQEQDIQKKIANQQKAIEQKYAEGAQRHERKSTQSLPVLAVKQAFAHGEDLLTHRVDSQMHVIAKDAMLNNKSPHKHDNEEKNQ